MKKISIITMLFALLSLSACGSSPSDPPIDGGDKPDIKPTEVSLTIDNTTPVTDDNKVIYELNLYDFTNEGTLIAAQNKLGELRKLGVDIIWLMPIHPRGALGRIGELGSPYAVKDYYAVNPDFGTLADLQSFVSTAHQKGINVWLDWVPNHTALDAVWITEHPEYYTKQNGNFVNPNGYGDVYQLNMNAEATRQAMTDAMKYWVSEADIDGYRCDYASSPGIPPLFWTNVIPELKSVKSNLTVMAEADLGDQVKLLGCGFDCDYAWGFHDKLKAFGTSTNAAQLKTDCEWLINDNRFDNMNRMVYLTNHDDIGDNFSETYINYLGNNRNALTVLQFTLYGMPLLYNGQEIGYKPIMNYFNREPINWGAKDVKTQNTIRALVALKHTQKALTQGTLATRGKVKFITTDKPSVLAYTKTKDQNTVLVVLNFSNSEQKITLTGVPAGKYVQWIDSKTIASDIASDTATGKETNLTSVPVISLQAKGYAVYVTE